MVCNIPLYKVHLCELIRVPSYLLRLLLVLLQVVDHLQQVGQVPLDGVVVHVGLQGVVEPLHLQSLLLKQHTIGSQNPWDGPAIRN